MGSRSTRGIARSHRSLGARLHERDSFAAVGLAVIPYFSPASGFLTGKYRTEADLAKSPRGRLVKKYLNEHGLRILAALDAVAEKHRATPAQVSLAWLITRPTVAAPIASATSVEQLHDLIAATKLQLDTVAIEQLNQAST